jgi:ribosome-associated toxin RatA of RatAB toxin-antitoxin module
MRHLVGCLGSLLLLVSPSLAEEDGDRARLDRGEVILGTEQVAGSAVPFATARAVLNAPPPKVWRIVENCSAYTRNLPRIAASSEEKREDDWVLCRVTIATPFPMKNLTSLTRAVHRLEPGRWSREWTLVEGDYEVHEGRWILTPFGGDPSRTLVEYRIRVKPTTLVPQPIARMAQTRGLPELFAKLREVLGSSTAEP